MAFLHHHQPELAVLAPLDTVIPLRSLRGALLHFALREFHLQPIQEPPDEGGLPCVGRAHHEPGDPRETPGKPQGTPGKLCGARGEIHGYMVMAWREWLEIFQCCFFKILTWGCS